MPTMHIYCPIVPVPIYCLIVPVHIYSPIVPVEKSEVVEFAYRLLTINQNKR